ncbi:MAG: serine hydrolase domain-containing protein [Chloroflexota bacterium]
MAFQDRPTINIRSRLLLQTVPAESLDVSPERLERIHPVMERYTADRNVAGIVTLAARRGKVFHHGAYGWQDIQRRLPMKQDSIFRIYSMTKPIVSVALMMLYEQGRFQLYDPVSKYIPAFDMVRVLDQDGTYHAVEQPMTIHHLLTHTAGMGYGFFEDHPAEDLYRDADLRNNKLTLQEIVMRVSQLPLFYQPGTNWRYSVATDVVGYLVQVLADMPLSDFLQENILLPLEMYDTDFNVPPDKIDRFTTMYGQTENGNPLGILDDARSSHHLREFKYVRGGSGLVSTAEDYLNFAEMCRNKGTWNGKRFLGRKTMDYMTMNHIPASILPLKIGTPMPGIGFGLGFSTVLDPAERGVISSKGNHGWSGAADTHFWIDPEEDLIGMILIQYMPSGTHPVRHDFYSLIYQALN